MSANKWILILVGDGEIEVQTPVAQNIKGSSLADTGGLHVVTLPEWLAMERGLV